jgi:FtsZ-binding cell division protein ZapB
MSDLRNKRAPLPDSATDPELSLKEGAESSNTSAEHPPSVVEPIPLPTEIPSPFETPSAEVGQSSHVLVGVAPPTVAVEDHREHSSSIELAEPSTPYLSAEGAELSPPAVATVSNEISESRSGSTATEVSSGPSISTERELLAEVRPQEKSSQVTDAVQSAGQLQRSVTAISPSVPQRSKGCIETIEEVCQQSLEGINKLILRLDERDNQEVSRLQHERAMLERQIKELVSERDSLTNNCTDWQRAYNSLKDELGKSAPYQEIFSNSLPTWLGLDALRSLLAQSPDEGADYRANPKIIWKILPVYISLIDELKSGTLTPRQLTSATDAFSEAVCSLFESDAPEITSWHENANEYLKTAGYSYLILAVGTPIDNDLVTGAIQGKTTIGSIKRMVLTKDGGDVIRKADVTGV